MIIDRTDNLVDIESSFQLLKGLDNLYPDFNKWYFNNYSKRPLDHQDIVIVAKDQSRVVGVVLAKKTLSETKLRCIRVAPAMSNSGLGLKLIEKSFEHLECEKPHCTVAEEMLHQYSRAFINRYGFELGKVDKGLYRPGKLEYLFN